jgi:hypothetical protein
MDRRSGGVLCLVFGGFVKNVSTAVPTTRQVQKRFRCALLLSDCVLVPVNVRCTRIAVVLFHEVAVVFTSSVGVAERKPCANFSADAVRVVAALGGTLGQGIRCALVLAVLFNFERLRVRATMGGKEQQRLIFIAR